MKLSRIQLKISKGLHMKDQEGLVKLISVIVIMGVMISVR